MKIKVTHPIYEERKPGEVELLEAGLYYERPAKTTRAYIAANLAIEAKEVEE